MKQLGDSTRKIYGRIISFFYSFRFIIVAIVVIALFLFVTFRIDYFSSAERDENIYNEKSLTIKKIEFDEEAINKIRRLRDQGIDIQPQYESGRNDPFSD